MLAGWLIWTKVARNGSASQKQESEETVLQKLAGGKHLRKLDLLLHFFFFL